MSYAKWGCDGSEVYVFKNGEGKFECHECRLEDETVTFDLPNEMITHLEEHTDAGHNVPDDCVKELAKEVALTDREIAYLLAWIVVEETMFDVEGKIQVEERPVVKGIAILSDASPECLGPGSWATITSAPGVTYQDAKRNLKSVCETWHSWLIPHVDWK